VTRIDIVSDFVCPWCYIGKRQLDALRARVAVETRWHPYLLHPDVPPGGIDRAALMRTKFGDASRARDLGQAVEAAARGAGLYLQLDAVERIPDTRDAHRIMRWAGGQGLADALGELLFAAHFVDGRDIGDHDVLADLAAQAGLDRSLVLELLGGDADRQAVETQADRARASGISGVPTVIASGAEADRQAIAAWMEASGNVAGRWFFVGPRSAV